MCERKRGREKIRQDNREKRKERVIESEREKERKRESAKDCGCLLRRTSANKANSQTPRLSTDERTHTNKPIHTKSANDALDSLTSGGDLEVKIGRP